MYNDRMPIYASEIRICSACGLRYPLVEDHPFGIRCPACLGDTHVVGRREWRTDTADRSHGQDEHGKGWAVLLDNIRSAWNVGSILRSADGFRFRHAYLCGITPTPDQGAVTKTSLGAEQSVPWSYHKDAVKLADGLRAAGWKIHALEEDARAVDIIHAQSRRDGSSRQVLIVGNEVSGVDPELLEQCDQIYYIPMRGEKRSFNVAIAFGIAAYALHEQRQDQ